MNRSSVAVFCDFDGTVSRRDIGYNVFRHFSKGRNDELLPDWISGRLSTRDCLRKEAAMSPLTEESLFAFLDGFELDAAFPRFIEVCRRDGVDIRVVSDGLDIYIEYVLGRFGLGDLSIICNHARVNDGHLEVSFPHDNRHCDRCGSCKGERIREYRQQRGDPVTVVFVGDGYSDACATTEADIVFAKKDLEDYCRANNIEYRSYDSFDDVRQHLERMSLLSG